MKKDDIERLKALDPESQSGTIQSILMDKNIDKMQFSEAVYFLLKKSLDEKAQYAEENKKMCKILKDKGLYTSEILMEYGIL